MKTNRGGAAGDRGSRWRWPALTWLMAIWYVGPAASAHVTSGANCASCHSTARSGMTVTGHETTANLGVGTLKVFRVQPGQAVSIGVNVTDGHTQYGLAIVNLDAGGLASSAHRLTYAADPTWTKRSGYFSVGPSSANTTRTFRLTVSSGTAVDAYLVRVRMAGTGGGRWSQEESFYVQVVAPTPPVPAVTEPRWSGGLFTCKVATVAGFTYHLETKLGVGDAAWVEAARVAGDGTVKTLSDTQAVAASSVYRVRAD